MAGKSKWKTWLGVSAIFVFGIFTGLLIAAAFVHHVIGIAHSDPHAFEGMALHLLDRHLDFTDEQEAEIQHIIYASHEELMTFKNEHLAELEGIIGPGLDEIGQTMTAEQRPKWDDLRGRIEEHMRAGGAD